MMLELFPSTADLPLPPPPAGMQIAMTFISVSSILLPAGPIRLCSGTILVGMLFYLVFWTAEQSSAGYLAANNCTAVFYRWLDLVAFHQPERDFWQVNTSDAGGERSKAEAPSGYWQKLKWFFNLWIAQRGIGWNIQSKSLPPPLPKGYPMSVYVMKSLFRLVDIYFRLDVTQNAIRFMRSNTPFYTLSFPTQVLLAWMTAFKAYFGIELAYTATALLSVTIGFSNPTDWPPISGAFRKDAWSVRKMWGSCWHQLMRRPCSEAGRIVKDIFGFKKGSFASRYSQIWIAFAVSAFSHHMGAIVGMFEDGGCSQILYFAMQPVGIMFEDLVIWVGTRFGIQESIWTKRLGFVWVICWFSFWLRTMVAFQPLSWNENFAIPSLIAYLSSIGIEK